MIEIYNIVLVMLNSQTILSMILALALSLQKSIDTSKLKFASFAEERGCFNSSTVCALGVVHTVLLS